jgi:hypothetical protein
MVAQVQDLDIYGAYGHLICAGLSPNFRNVMTCTACCKTGNQPGSASLVRSDTYLKLRVQVTRKISSLATRPRSKVFNVRQHMSRKLIPSSLLPCYCLLGSEVFNHCPALHPRSRSLNYRVIDPARHWFSEVEQFKTQISNASNSGRGCAVFRLPFGLSRVSSLRRWHPLVAGALPVNALYSVSSKRTSGMAVRINCQRRWAVSALQVCPPIPVVTLEFGFNS